LFLRHGRGFLLAVAEVLYDPASALEVLGAELVVDDLQVRDGVDAVLDVDDVGVVEAVVEREKGGEGR